MKTTSKVFKALLGWGTKCLLIAVVVTLATGVSGTANSQSPVSYMLVAPVTIPGQGGSNPAYLTPVLRFQFVGTGPFTSLSSIPAFPESLVNDPSYVAFNSQGELFVANRHGCRQGLGSIARFTFDAAGNFVANGSITGNSLEVVHGLAFSATGELFAANYFNGTISRFLFDGMGNAIANGTFATARSYNQGLAFASNGELFTTHSSSEVRRFLFDSITGAAIPNGSFDVPGSSMLHGLGFSTQGELFVADVDTDSVFRFLFDSVGNPIGNGTISVPGGPVGVAFSPAGELFVTSHLVGGISRFLFDGSGNAIPNGFTATDHLGGVAIFFLLMMEEVEIDIKPGSDPNCFSNDGHGVIPIAILTTDTFDAATVDPFSVTMDGAGVRVKGKSGNAGSLEDVDGDGDLDLVVQIEDMDGTYEPGDATATLTGKTFDGTQIQGTDTVCIVP